jgi:hypothetical protein
MSAAACILLVTMAQVPASTPAPASSGAPQRADDEARPEDLRAPADEDGPRTRLNVAGWAAAGVTAALLGVAAFYGASAAEKAGDANRLISYHDPDTGIPLEYAKVATDFEDDLRVGRHDDTLARVFLISAAVTAAATTALFVADGLRGSSAGPATSAALPRAAGPLASLGSTGVVPASVRLAWTFR